jgi:glycosyltransferase involved in cell wall biosynthesis
MRILLSCYYFSPYRGGEAAVGWQYATGLAKLGHEVTVLYGDLAGSMPMKADVERYARETGLPANLMAVHVPPEPAARFIHQLHAKPGMFFLYYPAYRLWQKANLREASRLHATKSFDLAHHLTIIGYREPGYLWKLGIPFFWGPINGAAALPWGFVAGLGWKGRYQHTLRNALNWLQMRLPSRSRKAAAGAAKIWAVTEEDRKMVEDIWGFQADTMIETGAQPSANATLRKRDVGEPLQLIWCGILEARKSLHLVLHALYQLPKDVECELHVIGEGAERGRWQQLAETLGIVEQVIWHGRVPHAEAQRLMARGHILIHSAVKEGTPHVVLEAMAQGMPVICHDACGMGVAVDENSGIKVPLHDPATSVAGFRNAILRLCNEPDLLSKLSQGALDRATQLTWDNKVKQVADTYHKILSENP